MKLSRIIALFVCFALIISVFPALAQTDGEIKWICKKSTRIRNAETGELWFPDIPEGFEDYFVDWSNISFDTPDWWGHSLHISNSTGWLSYRIPIEEAGVYELFTKAGTYPDYGADIEVEVNGSIASNARIDTGDWEPNQTVSLGYVPLNEGENDLKINFSFRSGGALAIYYYWLEPVEAPAVESYFANETEFADGDVIPRGTDLIAVEISNELHPDAVSGIEATLKGDEKKLSTIVSGDGNRVVISISDSLDYNENYTLSLANIKDIYGYVIDDVSIDFTSSDAEGDLGTATSVITDAPDMQNTHIMKVSGMIKNSSGDGISGRKACLTITDPLGTELAKQETVSAENGVVEFSYELSEDAQAGVYAVNLTTEYCDEGDISYVRYISEQLKNQILGELKTAEEADDVETILISYSQELGVDTSDLEEVTDNLTGEVLQYGISDRDRFYERFAGCSFGNIREFADTYELNLSMERFLQNPSPEARGKILKTAVFSGVDKERMDYIAPENEAEFFNDVSNLNRDDADTPEKLAKAYNDLTNKYFMLCNSKENIVLTMADLSVYKGEQAQISLNCNEVCDVVSYTLCVTAESDISMDTHLVLADGSDVTADTGNNTLSFTVNNPDFAGNYSLGTLTYDSRLTGQHTFDFGGTVVYKTADFPYEIYAQIEPVQITLSVKVNIAPSGPSYSSSVSSGRGGGGGVSVVTPPAVAEKAEQFTDLGDASWAEDSVMYLFERGIISAAPDKKFRPNDSVTRAEFVKMLVESVGMEDTEGTASFNDVKKDAWYYEYVQKAANSGIVLGNNTNCFEPDGNITRQDICVILSRVMNMMGYPDGNYDNPFADNDKIADYAVNAVYRLRDFGVINGVGDNCFEPYGFATRAMTAKILEQFLRGVKA